MAETAVILGVAQVVTGVVVPVTIAALPAIWKEIVKFLKNMNMKRSASGEDQHNLSIIQSTLAKLERIRDLPEWLGIPKATSLVAMLQSQAKSLKAMIDKHILRSIPKKRLSERIKSIAVLLQRLDDNAGLELYQKRKEYLHKDLLDVLSKDNLLVPVIAPSEDLVTTFPGIRYEFQYHGDPARTQLTISSSVIECIEHALRWLRDFKLDISCGTVRGSIDVALYEVFTEILPQALMDHLDRRRFGPIETQQFHANMCFLRSFSRSSTFRDIQGEAGLKLEGEEKIDVDLRDAGWTIWNDLQQRIDFNNRTSTFEVAETSSRRESLTRGSASDLVYICDHCDHIYIRGYNQVDVDRLREKHSLKCRRKQQQLNYNSQLDASRCPLCPALIGHLSPHDQQVHINACLDAS